MHRTDDNWNDLPPCWHSTVDRLLEPGESLLAWFEPNLDERLCFVRGLVILTDRRLASLCMPAAEEKGQAVEQDWQTWMLVPEYSLRIIVNGGLGTLELAGPSDLLAIWRFTVAVAPAARRLLAAWDTARDGKAAPSWSICPSCGAPMAMTDERCAACAPTSSHSALASLWRLMTFVRPRAGVVTLGLCLTLASTAAGLIPPYLSMPLLDKVLIPLQNKQAVDFQVICGYLMVLAGAAVLVWLLDWARLYVSSWIGERISTDMRLRAFSHLQKLSLEFFGGKRTGDLITRVSSDSDRLCTFLSVHLADFAADILMIVMTSTFMLYIDRWMALATLCPFPLIIWLVHWVRRRLLQGYRRGGIAWSEMTSVLADTIPGIRVVKAFAQEEREYGRFLASNNRVLQANDRVNWTWSFFGPVVTFLTTLGLLVVWAFATWRVKDERITVGVMTAFLAYITRFYTRSESMIRFISNAQRAAASSQRIFEILDRPPTVSEPLHPVHPGRVAGRIELQGVRFKYGTREVLHGIDLKIEPGEMIGLVGPSGAGKSTLVNLICRFYDVAEGVIRVDGADIRTFSLEEYRRNIGIVLQEPYLFYGTVAENIAYGRPEATRAEILAAARAARAHEFILRLPDGYDSLVGERGQSLSGGERQRISIARALLIDPRILILDEATSSVDTVTEREIQEALGILIQGRTTIAIAHRLSTLRRASRIVVLDRGKIVEVGAHQELLQNRGNYANLHRAQLEMAQGHIV